MAFQVARDGYRPVSSTGNVYPAGTLEFFEAGSSTTPITVYAERSLTTSLGSVVTASGDGLWPDMWVNEDYRVVLRDNDNVQQWSRDIYSPLGVDSVTTDSIVDGAVTLAKIEMLDDGKIIIGGTTANGQHALSNHVTMSNTGVVTISDNVLTQDMASANLSSQYGVLPNTVSGLTLSNDVTDPDHDIVIAEGICSDSGQDSYIKYGGGTVSIDINIGTGTGGFPSALTLLADTWYRVFLCAKDDGVDPVPVFDTSSSAANAFFDLGGTYTIYKRIGWVRTDSSSNILAFIQYKDRFLWETPVQTASFSTVATRTALELLAPPQTEVNFKTSLSSTSSLATYVLFTTENQADITPSSTAYDIYALLTVAPTEVDAFMNLFVLSNSSSEIYHRADDTSGTLTIYTAGWTDLFDN